MSRIGPALTGLGSMDPVLPHRRLYAVDEYGDVSAPSTGMVIVSACGAEIARS